MEIEINEENLNLLLNQIRKHLNDNSMEFILLGKDVTFLSVMDKIKKDDPGHPIEVYLLASRYISDIVDDFFKP